MFYYESTFALIGLHKKGKPVP